MMALPNTLIFLLPLFRRLSFGRDLDKPDRLFFFCRSLPMIIIAVVWKKCKCKCYRGTFFEGVCTVGLGMFDESLVMGR